MRARYTYSVVHVLVVALASCAVHCRQLQQGNEIPPRCRQVSVTPVSCAQLPPDSLMPHPDDCELFYYCVSSVAQPICRQCPANLNFNPRLHVCDHPAAAGCQLRNPSSLPTPAPTGETSAPESTTHVWYYTTW